MKNIEKKTILCVDDKPDSVRALIADLNDEIDCTVLLVRSLQSAIEKLHNKNISLAIIDLYIPSGHFVLQNELRQGEQVFMNQGQLLARKFEKEGVPYLIYTNTPNNWIDDDLQKKDFIFNKDPEGLNKVLTHARNILSKKKQSFISRLKR